MDLAPYLADYGTDAHLSILDHDGQAFATPTSTDLAEYARTGIVRGDQDNAIGVVWIEGENVVAVCLTAAEVAALVEVAS